MRIIKLPKSISSFCSLCGSDYGISMVSGGTSNDRIMVMNGHLKQAMWDGKPTIAVLQDASPELDASLDDFADKSETDLRIVNNSTKGFAPFIGWPSFLFAQFICDMLPASAISPTLYASAQKTFQTAADSGNISLITLQNSIPKDYPDDKATIQNVLQRVQQAMLPILPDKDTPEEEQFNFYPSTVGREMRVFHLDVITNRDYVLALTYLKAELENHREKVWVCDLMNHNIYLPFLMQRISMGNLGICAPDVPLILQQCAPHPGMMPKIMNAAILYHNHRPVNASDLRLLDEPDLTIHDIHWLARAVFYHGKTGPIADARIWVSPWLF